MPFLTVFSAPKPFTDPHIATIQRNAVQSWIRLGDQMETFLMGDEPGIAEVAADLGVRHFPEVRRNQWGTPLLSSMFEHARWASQSPYLAFVNADIILLPDFVEATRRVASLTDRFLILGQRWNLDVQEALDFGSGWVERLREEIRRRGSLHAPIGSDFFVYPRSALTEMPDFAVGRSGWDNWTIYHARSLGWAVVDVTPSVLVIHQNHGYGHLPGYKSPHTTEETQLNIKLAGGAAHMYTILDTNKQLRHGRLRLPRPTVLRTIRRAEVWLMPPDNRPGTRKALTRKLKRLRRRISGSL